MVRINNMIFLIHAISGSLLRCVYHPRRMDYTSGKKTFVYSERTRPKEPEEPDVSIARERAQKLLSCAQKTVSAAHQRLKEPLRAL